MEVPRDVALKSFPSWKWEPASRKRGAFPVYKMNGHVLDIFQVLLRSKYKGDLRPRLGRLKEDDWREMCAKKASRIRLAADMYYDRQLAAAKNAFVTGVRRAARIRNRIKNCSESPSTSTQVESNDTPAVVPNEPYVPHHLDPLPDPVELTFAALDEALRQIRLSEKQLQEAAVLTNAGGVLQDVDRADHALVNDAGWNSAFNGISGIRDDIAYSIRDGVISDAPVVPERITQTDDVAVELRRLPNEFDPEEFEELEVTRERLGVVRTRIKFSEIFMDWVISEDIPREVAMRFIRALKEERAEYDLKEMPICWVSLTKLYTRKLRKIAPIRQAVDAQGKAIPDSDYFYLGLRKQLSKRVWRILAGTFPEGNHPRRPHFFVELWTDGVPLNKTGYANELWPVSCSVIGVGDNWTSRHRYVPPCESQPFTVAMYLAPSKPEHGEVILRDVVRELVQLDPRDTGNTEFVENVGFSVSLRAFAGDLPATATVKSVYGHTSGRPCFKCRVKGHKVNDVGEGVMIFEITNLDIREDQYFLQYDEHVVKTKPRSPLCELKYFGMVSGFYLDSMHTLYLDVIRSLASHLLDFNREYFKPRDLLKHVLDSRMNVLASFKPIEFDRRISPVTQCTAWKANEARQFITYVAYGVVEDLVDEESLKLVAMMQYFIYLIGGMSPKPVPEQNLQFAERIARAYVSLWCRKKGAGASVTVHSLQHIPADCRHFQCHYDRLSTFKYENSAGPVKKMVTSAFGKLAQIRTRLIEKEMFVFFRDEDDRIMRGPNGAPSVGTADHPYELALRKVRIDHRVGKAYSVEKMTKGGKQLRFKQFVIRNNGFKDCFCLMRERLFGDDRDEYHIVRCTDFVQAKDTGRVFIVGVKYNRVRDLFFAPGKSTVQHVYVFSDPYPDSYPKSKWTLSSLVGKLYVFPRFAKLESGGVKDKGSDDFMDWEKQPDPVFLKDLGPVGQNYPCVDEWIGVWIRHTGKDGDRNTLY